MSSTNDIVAQYKKMSIGNYKLTTNNYSFNDKMSLYMDKDFSDYLVDEMKKRGWTQADLSKAAGINRQVISTYVNRQRKKPEVDVLVSIARALKIPPETVMRAAGLLPKTDQSTQQSQELLYLFDQLKQAWQEDLLNYAHFLLEKQDRGA